MDSVSTIRQLARLTVVVGATVWIHYSYGAHVGLLTLIGLFSIGALPPIFPLLYKAYTTRAFGYRIRHALHPRLAPHSTVIRAARRLIAQPGADSGVIILPVPVLADNYAYLIISERSGTCAVVDAADPHRIVGVAKELNLDIALVLTTHKHWDHAGGNEELKLMLANRSVDFVGSSVDRPAATTRFVGDGDLIEFSDVRIRAVATPGHTRGHLMYLVSQASGASSDTNLAEVPRRRLDTLELLRARDFLFHPDAPGTTDHHDGGIPTCPVNAALLTGDCIFCGGCGAMFECRSAADILSTYDALDRILSATPQGLVFVGHEYSLRLFADLVRRPDTMPPGTLRTCQQRLMEIQTARAQHFATVPSSMAVELQTNPLLTLNREVLAKLAREAAPATNIDSLIYMSHERRNRD